MHIIVWYQFCQCFQIMAKEYPPNVAHPRNPIRGRNTHQERSITDLTLNITSDHTLVVSAGDQTFQSISNFTTRTMQELSCSLRLVKATSKVSNVFYRPKPQTVSHETVAVLPIDHPTMGTTSASHKSVSVLKQAKSQHAPVLFGQAALT